MRTSVGPLLAASAGLLASTIAIAAPGADVYGEYPAFDRVQIAPEGGRIAFIAVRDGEHTVVIENLESDASCEFRTSRLKLRELFWAPGDRLVLRLTPAIAERDRYVSIGPDCKNPKLLFDGDVLNDQSPIAWEPGGRRMLWHAIRPLPTRGPSGGFGWGYIPMRIQFALDIVAVDPATGKQETIEKGGATTLRWIVDATGTPRLRIDEGKLQEVNVFARLGAQTDWTEIYSSASVTDAAHAVNFVAMSSKPDTAVVITRNGTDRRGAYEFNLRTRQLSRIFEHQAFDVGDFQLDPYTSLATGYDFIDEVNRSEYIDPAIQQALVQIRQSLPGRRLRLLSWSSDRAKFIVRADGPQNPTGTYFVADVANGQVSELGARRPGISEIAPTRFFSYKARDGLAISAYLTLPPGSAGKNIPLVVMPHGGPEARDEGEFDSWTQFLATRGYAVLRPQFRGSDGFGWAFKEAGRLQWGLKMQDDITDGVKSLVADGTVDATKICIFGWSYGGYAALAGLAFTPDLYKCGAAGAAPSDLRTILGDERKKRSNWREFKYWPSVIGDPFKDGERLDATSPARHAGNIRAPLLLVHAKNDSVVNFSQSEIMARALRRAGKPFKFVELEGDDHWLSYPETEKRVLKELEQFLAENLK